MTAVATSYVGRPDIPVGMTIAEYRRFRTHLPWWHGLFRRLVWA
jgi:hypothetical protein